MSAAVRLGSLVAAVFLGISGGARAQEAPQQCVGEKHRQFDFWLGDWEVHSPTGQYQGANRIELIEGGCVLQEHWMGAQGGTGTSFNIYDFTRDRWHQTWVSGTMLLVLEGALHDRSMVLEGETVGREGDAVHHRITWTPLGADSVRQHWEQSADGAAWRTVFDGLYTRSRR